MLIYEGWIMHRTDLYLQPPVSWSHRPFYARYPTEVATTSYNFYEGAEFIKVTFVNPQIWRTNDRPLYLYSLYSNGNYNTYIRNLTTNSNQDVMDCTTSMPGYLFSVIYPNNSNFSYQG